MKQNLTLTVFSILLATACIVVPSIVQAVTADKASSNASLNRGLVGYWTFDGKDMANGVALDKSGNGNTGKLSGIATSTFYSEGKIGQAGKFDGVNDYVNTANIADNLSEMTVSFWFNYNGTIATDQNQIAVGKIGNFFTGAGWGVFAFGTGSNNGKLAFFTQEAGGVNWKQKNTNSTYNDSKWHHFIATLSGGVGGTITIYIDGAPASVTDMSGGGAFSSISNSLNVTIGKNSVTNNPYKGLMDDVRIYNRALSATEVQQLYNAGR